MSIGGIDFRLKTAAAGEVFQLEPAYEQFLVTDESRGTDRADVELTVRYQDPPATADAERVFDTGSNWTLNRRGGSYLMPIYSQAIDPNLYKMLVIDEDLTRGDIYLTPGAKSVRSHSRSRGESLEIKNYPFQYPLDEVLTVNLLSRARGVEIHGLGIDLGGKGVIFTGTSGAGKSTLAELWKKRPGNTILSDDRLVVRPAAANHGSDRESFILYGTPWHGDAGVSAPGGIPLERIAFINQAADNTLVPMPPAEAVTELLVRSFPTFWDPDGMEFTVDFIGRICESVPCYRLDFLPEQAALDVAVEGL